MDLFGGALLDYQNGKRVDPLVIRRDDDHTDAHSPGLYFVREPFAHEADLLEHVEGPVLDVGCGAGRTVLWLQGQGVDTTGVDLSAGAIETCRLRGCRDVRRIDATSGLGGGPEWPAFRTAILFGNNLGIGGTYEGAGRLLRSVARAMAPHGRLLVTALDVARTHDPSHLAYHERNRAAGRPRGEITMRFEYGDAIGPWVRWLHPEPAELERIAADTGWAVEAMEAPGGAFYQAQLRLVP